MVFLISPYGNHSNQLIQIAQFESFCSENGIRFRSVVRGKLKKMIRYKYSGLADCLLRAVLRLGRKTRMFRYFDVDDFSSFDEMAEAVRRYGTKGILLVSGFLFRDNDLLAKYRDSIVSRYHTVEKAEDLDRLAELKKSGRPIVGMHVRLGDYRDYAEGRYFYPVPLYARWARDFTAQNALDNPILVVFSDQALSQKDFTGFPDVLVSHNPYNVDYELMGLCDFLIGPPSTFTQWASYTYRVPYFHINDHSVSEIRKEQFVVAFCD